MSVDAIIKGAAVIQRTIPGINEAHDNAPESINVLPCFVTYPDTFTVERAGANLRTTVHQLRMLLLVNRTGDLAGADATLKPFIDTVISTFDQNITLGGSAWSSEVKSGKYGVIEYASTQYLGIDFVLEVEERESVFYHK